MSNTKYDIVVIGGSAGSIPVVIQILESLPAHTRVPMVIVIHRLKNVVSELSTLLSHTRLVIEPEDKSPIEEGGIYLAPQNYHLLVEYSKTFGLDYSEAVNYSRPSIDVTYSSVSEVYKNRVLGILLSGANNDGAQGLKEIMLNGGGGIVQDPASAEHIALPVAAISLCDGVAVLTPQSIIEELIKVLC